MKPDQRGNKTTTTTTTTKAQIGIPPVSLGIEYCDKLFVNYLLNTIIIIFDKIQIFIFNNLYKT